MSLPVNFYKNLRGDVSESGNIESLKCNNVMQDICHEVVQNCHNERVVVKNCRNSKVQGVIYGNW